MKNLVNLSMTSKGIIIYTDGGSRGNPGPAAAGFIVAGRPYGEFLGKATNNEAEYKAIIFALKKAKQILGGERSSQAELEVRSDSSLIVEQLSGSYKILEPKLQSLFLEAWNSKLDFKKVIFKQIPREKNNEADRLVNQTLDNSSSHQTNLF